MCGGCHDEKRKRRQYIIVASFVSAPLVRRSLRVPHFLLLLLLLLFHPYQTHTAPLARSWASSDTLRHISRHFDCHWFTRENRDRSCRWTGGRLVFRSSLLGFVQRLHPHRGLCQRRPFSFFFTVIIIIVFFSVLRLFSRRDNKNKPNK